MKFKVRYPSITTFLLSAFIAIGLWQLDIFEKLFANIPSDLGLLGYVGLFFVGVLFSITITTPLATAAIFYVGGHFAFLPSFFVATMGAVVGDLIVFSLVKDHTLAEIHSLIKEHKHSHPSHRNKVLKEVFKSKFFHGLAMFLGGLIIVSPLPDELGIAIFASYKVRFGRFLPFSFLLNGLGVWLILLASRISN